MLLFSSFLPNIQLTQHNPKDMDIAKGGNVEMVIRIFLHPYPHLI